MTKIDTTKPIVLVLGSTGQVGKLIVEALNHSKEVRVRVTSRRQEQVEALRKQGQDAVYLDLDDPRTFAGALAGVDRIVDVNFAANVAIADATLRTNVVVALYAGNPEDRLDLPLLPWMLRNITIRTILVYTMPQAAKDAAIRDITTALGDSALHHNIARRFPLEQVAAAHEAQDSGHMVGKAIVEIA